MITGLVLLVPEVVGPGSPQSPPIPLPVQRRQGRALRSPERRRVPLEHRSVEAGLAEGVSPVIIGMDESVYASPRRDGEISLGSMIDKPRPSTG